MNQLRIYKVLVFFLIVLNLGTLSYFWWTAKEPHHRHRIPISKVLELDEKTAKNINNLEREHFAAKEKLLQKNSSLHLELFNAFKDENDERKAELIDSIAANHKQIELMTFAYFKKVNEVCSPDQQKKLERLIKDVFSHAGSPPNPPRK